MPVLRVIANRQDAKKSPGSLWKTLRVFSELLKYPISGTDFPCQNLMQNSTVTRLAVKKIRKKLPPFFEEESERSEQVEAFRKADTSAGMTYRALI